MNCHFQIPCISPPSATLCPGHISFPYHAVFGGTLEVSHLQMSLMHSETNVHPFENGLLVSVAIFVPFCITPVVMLL